MNLALEKIVSGEIWVSNEAYKNLLILCDTFGSRFAGSNEEKMAGAFIVESFKKYGLENVSVETFKLLGWQRSPVKFQLLTPAKTELDAISLAFSPPTPQGGVKGNIVYLEVGSKEDFERKKDFIKGQIVLCKTEPYKNNRIKQADRIHRAKEYGAIGYILMNHIPGQLLKTGNSRELPSIGISYETGMFLLRRLSKAELLVNMILNNTFNTKTESRNITGELKGYKYPERAILVGAHFDGHDLAQGTLDNASGTSIIMEVARALAIHTKGKLKRTIRFICFGAEEAGLLGSKNYVATHQDEMRSIDVMINCDATGVVASPIFIVQNRKLMDYLTTFSTEIACPIKTEYSEEITADHAAFALSGIPTIWYNSKGVQTISKQTGYMHTKADIVDKINPQNLATAAIKFAQLVIKLANLEFEGLDTNVF